MLNSGQFFGTARERYRIKERREKGLPRPWTDDKIFNLWRFCNVHREDDKTTQWFRDHVRNPLTRQGDKIKIAQATTIFRWFNRIGTGEKILDLLLTQWDTEEAHRRLQSVEPVVTGAYIIKGPDGFSKLEGVLHCIDLALPALEHDVPSWGETLKEAWLDLNTIYYLGPFMSYEIVSDLRWTPVLNEAADILTWANAGPGCARGMGWVAHNNPAKFNPGSQRDQQTMLELMTQLLGMSRSEEYWPKYWKQWEMREVEHWLCEYDKYCRAESGLKLKRRYA